MRLIERDEQLRELYAALDAAVAGRGRLLRVEGPGGIGKSSLLEALRERAAGMPVRVLTARASQLGREYAFGVARELLAPAAARSRSEVAAPARVLVAGDGTSSAPAERAALLHALWWMLVELAEEAPLALLVDDAHWCDEPSLDFLAHLGPRLHDLPVLAVVAARPERAVAALATADGVALPALSHDGIARLVERELGEPADAGFVLACGAAAGGNPFLTGELLRDLRREAVPPRATAVARVHDAKPESIARAVLVRLAREAPAALELARAVAVLGSGAMLHHAAALAGLAPDDAAPTAAALMRAEVLGDRRPLEFVHPIVRASVYEDMTTAERGALHARAARVLAAGGAPPEQVASHLLEAEPAGDPWAVERLLEAAHVARGRAAPEVAADYLRRALQEPPGPERRTDVRLQLGRAEALAGAPGGGLEHLRAALVERPPGRERAQLAGEIAQACVPLSRFDEAVATLEDAIAGLGPDERDLALRLEAMQASAGRLHPSTFASTGRRLARVAAELAGETPAERVVLATWAAQQMFEARPAAQTLAVAERVMAGGLVAEQTADTSPVIDCLFVRVVCDDPRRAQRACDEVLADGRRRGSLMGIGVSLCLRSHVAWRRGAIEDAERDARAALAAAAPGRHARAVLAAAFLCDALVERGATGEAATLLSDRELGGELPQSFPFTFVLFSRARLRLAAGDTAVGIADLRELGARDAYTRNPAVIPWRSALAVALAPREDPEKADALAREELEVARAVGSPRAVALALHALGVVRRDQALLREAAASLGSAGAPLERARALVDLGAAMRRAGEVSEAREPLREGGQIAHRCGAASLAARARDELAATGVRRVKRLLLSGVDGLTPSELRVARLAGEGMTNRAIAEALYVTPKTVEVHLGHAYRKLGISSRGELAEALR